jgi:hypothetical protein
VEVKNRGRDIALRRPRRKAALQIAQTARFKTIIFGCRIGLEHEGSIRQELQRRKRTFGRIRLLRCKKNVIPSSS